MAQVCLVFRIELTWPQNMPDHTIPFTPYIAHRGAHLDLPENSLEAFQKAKRQGSKWIECDIQLTADHIPIIFHDLTLERMTAHAGKVIETDYETLAKWPLAYPHPSSQSTPCFIPTFSQALTCFSELNLCAHLEIKNDPAHADITAEIFAETLKRFPYFNPHNTMISGGDLNALAAAYYYLPEFKYGWVVDQILSQDALSHLPVPLFSIHMNYHHLSEKLVKDLKARGYLVLAYTVNDAAVADELFKWGVTSVFTDTLL